MSQLLKLLLDNRRPQQPLQARVRASANETTLYLYDAIVGDRETADWFGGVCPQDLVPLLASISTPTIHLRINSPGGDVFGAQAIAQALREHPSQTIAHIDGVCASAATVISSACKQAVMAKGALYMIHQASSFCWGNQDDMLHCAALLDKVDTTLADQYAERTGLKAQELLQLMKAETWFTATEAIAKGFVNGLDGEAQAPDPTTAGAQWRLDAYQHPPVQSVGLGRIDPPAAADPHATPDHRARQQQRLQLLARLPIR